MRQPFLIGVAAVLIGLFGAATVLAVLKPQDRPLQMPGLPQQSIKREPPIILVLGPPDAPRLVHLALGDDLEADKRAYHAVRTALETAPDSALNLLPAMSKDSPLHEAFAWALAADPDNRENFIDGLMGTTGDITPQVLSLLAQNGGLDPAFLKERAASSEVEQSMRQGHTVLPPSLPALYVNDMWLEAGDITLSNLEENLGVAQSEEGIAHEGRLIVTDAYAFATPPQPQTAAVFLTLRNAGIAAEQIVFASTPVAGRAELHGHTTDNGVMKMRPVKTIEVKEGETVRLDPHGLHIMLFDLPAPLAVGQSFPLTLRLQGGSEISVPVEVVPPGAVPAPVLTHEGHSG